MLLEHLAAAEHVGVADVLEVLSKRELAEACEWLDSNADGRRHQLVQRLRRLLRWLPLAEARAFARSLGLQSERAWRVWSGRRLQRRGRSGLLRGRRGPWWPRGLGELGLLALTGRQVGRRFPRRVVDQRYRDVERRLERPILLS